MQSPFSRDFSYPGSSVIALCLTLLILRLFIGVAERHVLTKLFRR